MIAILALGHDVAASGRTRRGKPVVHSLAGIVCMCENPGDPRRQNSVKLVLGHPSANQKLYASAAVTLLRQALKQGFARTPPDDVLEGLLSPCRTEVGKLSMIRNAAALSTNLTTELMNLLPRISVSTRILWGEDDAFQLVKYGERLAEDIPDAQIIRIVNARHFVIWDQPDEVAEHLRSFLVA